jgi:predicted nucleotidyltransferase
VNYLTPVEAVIPGVQGRVLAVLARTETPLTMRTVAQLAGVSPNRAASVLNSLVELGLIERREAGSAALVRLIRGNEAARAVLHLANLREEVVAKLKKEAATIRPAPASLVLFGSFAAGRADAGSDLDVLVVRSPEVREEDPAWIESLGHWADEAGRIAGNPVNLLQVSEHDLPQLLRKRQSVWRDIGRHGEVLAGAELPDLASVG